MRVDPAKLRDFLARYEESGDLDRSALESGLKPYDIASDRATDRRVKGRIDGVERRIVTRLRGQWQKIRRPDGGHQPELVEIESGSAVEDYRRIADPVELPARSAGVYFLVRHARVEYVGRTSSGARRALDHDLVVFDRVIFVQVAPGSEAAIESALILALRPPANRYFPRMAERAVDRLFSAFRAAHPELSDLLVCES